MIILNIHTAHVFVIFTDVVSMVVQVALTKRSLVIACLVIATILAVGREASIIGRSPINCAKKQAIPTTTMQKQFHAVVSGIRL